MQVHMTEKISAVTLRIRSPKSNELFVFLREAMCKILRESSQQFLRYPADKGTMAKSPCDLEMKVKVTKLSELYTHYGKPICKI